LMAGEAGGMEIEEIEEKTSENLSKRTWMRGLSSIILITEFILRWT
jgi:succinyl-CoA synthetase beta subunit